MARGNMVVTLIAQTKNFSQNLRNAGTAAQNFGKVLKAGFTVALTAIGALGGALFMFLPNLIRMAEESRKSERRLANIADKMGLFGEDTKKVTERLSEYAETLSFATGVDDELIRGAEAILLTFKNIAKTAGTVGGAFDRATVAALDLAAAGFGEVDTNAKQLGKALQDPIKGLGALRKAGVTFTEAEQKKIEALVEGNKLLEAQDIILSAIETQVGGTAEATASSMDRMQQRFEAVGEELGDVLIPYVDTLADNMIEWLDSVEGKQAIKKLTDQLEDFGAWIVSPEGEQAVKDLGESMAVLAGAAIGVGQGMQAIYKAVKDFTNIPRWLLELLLGEVNFNNLRTNIDRLDTYGTITGNTSAPGGPRPASAPVVVNVNGITPSVTIGKTVQQALNDAKRLGVR